jgi:hypothetical protein
MSLFWGSAYWSWHSCWPGHLEGFMAAPSDGTMPRIAAGLEVADGQRAQHVHAMVLL